jgi:hypothetical protein
MIRSRMEASTETIRDCIEARLKELFSGGSPNTHNRIMSAVELGIDDVYNKVGYSCAGEPVGGLSLTVNDDSDW